MTVQTKSTWFNRYGFLKILNDIARYWCFTPVFPATQEDCGSKPAQANSSVRPYLKKPFTKIGLVEWLKVKALSSSPSTTKKI
jgi:hypothetical protein